MRKVPRTESSELDNNKSILQMNLEKDNNIPTDKASEV